MKFNDKVKIVISENLPPTPSTVNYRTGKIVGMTWDNIGTKVWIVLLDIPLDNGQIGVVLPECYLRRIENGN